MDFLEGISKYLVTGKWFVNAIHEFNILALLGVIGVSLALLAGFVLLIEKVVVKTNQMNLTTRVSNSKKAAVSKQRPMILNIIQKELKKFFNVTIYVFNSGFGPIVLAIGGLAVLIFKEDLIGAVDLFSELNLSIEPLLLIVVGFIISTVFTSAISLSLEGKNFWLLKSLPIKAETVMFGKMFFNVLIVLPFAIFFIFMAGIALEIELINVLVSIIYVTSLSFLSSALGSIVNLHFPKFNYVNETEVVKQSLGAILGMFSTWLILTINGFMYYYLFEQMSFALIALLAVVVNVVLLVFAVVYIKTQSEKIFSHLP
jgi:ABC-2 type transport system permease protein